jgi:hypothetical protein
MIPPMIRNAAPLALSALLLVPAVGRGGCLAPTDAVVDTGVGSGPFWGNDAGSLLYVREAAGGLQALTLRTGGVSEDVGVSGDLNTFYVGSDAERWDTFYSGTVNSVGDLAFVAATKIPDNPSTSVNAGASLRGAYARSGASIYEIGRLGKASPVVDPIDGPVPWGTFYDAVASDRDATDRLRVIFSAQLAGTTDRRSGIFRWNEASPVTSVPAVMTGDAAPSGGTFISFGRLRGDGAGDAVFFAVTQLTPTSPQVAGLYYLRADGVLARLVTFGTDGDAAPGGGSFALAADFDIDDSGVVAFAATLQGMTPATALFRARPTTYAPELVLREGDETPIGGTYGSLARSVVRSNATGELVLLAPLSDDIGGSGLFTIPAGSSQALPLVATSDAVTAAAIGPGLAAFDTPTAVHVVSPSDGSVAGPTDFRIVGLDVRNAAAGPADSISFQGRFLLAPWGVVPPATFRADSTRYTTTDALTGAALSRIAEVKVAVSASPGNNFTFGVGGTGAAPVGTAEYNGSEETVKKLKVSADGSAATWTFTGAPGPGSFAIDLAKGTFRLTVSAARINGSSVASNFRVALFLRTDADVQQAHLDAESFFHGDFRIDAKQPKFGDGLRVTTDGSGTPGGTVFVDSLRVTRTAAKGTRPASDLIQAAGVLRMCPGTAAPATPKITATLHVGDFALDGVTMLRVGHTSAYRYTAPGVTFSIDLAKATFSLKASTTPLAALANAVQGSATNGPDHAVGGMTLPFTLSIPRVYEASFDVAMTRLPGGKVFQR